MFEDRDQGLAALQGGNTAEAVTLLERATQTDPTDYQAFMYLGAAYGQVERHNDAIQALTQAVTLQPSNAQGRYNLGIAMERAGYAPQALEAYQQAVQLQPDYPKAQEALARLQTASEPGFGLNAPITSPDSTQAMPPAETPTQYAAQPAQYAAQPTQYAPPQPGGYAPQPGQPMQAYGQPPAYGQPQMMPGQQPGAYGQPAMYPGYGAAAFQNTSGMKSDVPPEVAALKFNWGAFIFGWIWLCGHSLVGPGIGILVLGLVLRFVPIIGPFASIGIGIYLGMNGHKLAWRNRRYDSFEQFIQVERKWTQWGVGILVGLLLLGIIVGLLIAMTGGGNIPRSY